MKISVITPIFNSEKTIKENILSVVNQNYKNYEQIIIDNLSSDKSIDIIKNIYDEFKINDKLKIISEKDNGISNAFNKGIKASTGDLITILNSDDYFLFNELFAEVIKIFSDENILFAHGNVLFIDEIYGTNIRRPLLCPITKAFPYNHPGMFIRKKIYDDYGLFDESFKYAMDYEFFCRLYKNISNFSDRGFYIQGKPIAMMRAGGISWQKELDSVYEVKLALQKNLLWNFYAKENFIFRWIRIKLKMFLTKIKLNKMVSLWRNLKWRKIS